MASVPFFFHGQSWAVAARAVHVVTVMTFLTLPEAVSAV